MKIAISREQYEELKANNNPYIKLDMECNYFMEVLKERKGKRKSPKGRRSPTDMVRLAAKAESRRMSTDARADAKEVALSILSPEEQLPSSEMSKRLATLMGISKDMGSYYIGRLIDDKVMEVVRD